MGNLISNNQEQKDADATPHAKSERSEDAGKSESDSGREWWDTICNTYRASGCGKTASLVNEQSCKVHGKEMLKLAEAEFSNESTTTNFYKLFMQQTPSTSALTTESKLKLSGIYSEIFPCKD